MMDSTPLRLFTAAEAADVCSGRLAGSKNENCEIYSVVIDSRKAVKGSLFVALKGEKTDGHRYIADACAAGASCVLAALSEREFVNNLPNTSSSVYIFVDDPLGGLQQLARWWVSRFPDLVRIGITGSSGKTTTKEILRSILSRGSQTRGNEGNLNSEIGLPLSLFSLRPGDRYGVFEMGINFIGEMDILADLYRPQYVVVTNIGTAHSGPLGGAEGILKEKTKAFRYFMEESVAFLPEDDPMLDSLKDSCGGRSVLFGRKSVDTVSHVVNRGLEGWDFTYQGNPVHFSLPGAYNLRNMLAAVAAAEYFNVPPGEVKSGIEAVSPLSGRSTLHRGRLTIIEDSYNANADSTCRVLDFFDTLEGEGRKITVLGSMKELGTDSMRLHDLVGRKVGETAVDAVFLFGRETERICSYLQNTGFPGYCFYTDEFDILLKQLLKFVIPGDTVLLKGSRAMELERLVEPLQQPQEVTLRV